MDPEQVEIVLDVRDDAGGPIGAATVDMGWRKRSERPKRDVRRQRLKRDAKGRRRRGVRPRRNGLRN